MIFSNLSVQETGELLKISSACSDYLLENDGEDLVLLLDGYDEYPEKLQKDSLIASLLRHKVLPNCGLIISSRPHASVSPPWPGNSQGRTSWASLKLSENITSHSQWRVNHRMLMNSHDIFKVTQQSAVYASYPSTLLSLVYLYKQGIPLPQNSAQLYNYFYLSYHLPTP